MMRCPTLAELPPPPPGKTGWPWTVESPQLSRAMSDGASWPTISIVTPSYNQGEFVEETIRSILLQGYPNLEYIVIDGGSADESVAIIKKYSPWLIYWCSEPDKGQPHAINKGFTRASGSALQWINSDDFLCSGALGAVAKAYRPGHMVAGDVVFFGDGAETVAPNRSLTSHGLLGDESDGCRFAQPGIWFEKSCFDALGGLPESRQYAFDWEFLIKYLERWPSVIYVSQTLTKFRLHQNSKTVSAGDRFMADRIAIFEELLSKPLSEAARSACLENLDTHLWLEYLKVQKNVENHYVIAAISVAARALVKPRKRINRFTLGALKRLLLRPLERTI